MRKVLVLVGVVAVVALAGVSLAVISSSSDPEVARAGGLVQYDDCDALLDAIQAQAGEAVGPYGLDGGGFTTISGPIEEDFAEGDVIAEPQSAGDSEGDAAAPTTTAPSSAGTDEATSTDDAEGSTDFSTTNVQEEGVDEADVVKTDGDRLVTVVDGTLRVFDVTGDAPEELGSVEVPVDDSYDEYGGSGLELLLSGDTALVLGVTYGGAIGPMPIEDEDDFAASLDSYEAGGQGITTLVEVDLGDPTDPTVVHTAQVEGAYTTARMVGDVARIVSSTSAPDLGFVYPSEGGSQSEDVAEETNRRLVEESTLDQWLPVASVDDAEAVQAVACDQVGLPEETSGFGTATVVTVDLSEGLSIEPESAASVIGGSEVVYASTENLYVATSQWPDQAIIEELEEVPGIEEVSSLEELEDLDAEIDGRPIAEVVEDEVLPSTAVHRFALPADGPASYEASGEVPGRMLDQFSFSEHDGALRVATTVDDPGGSVSRLTTLAVDDLHELGSVGDIGRGEELYAVRMLGDVGYAVTFEQTDPLFTLDLSDPANPQVVGELEIPGYSSYLHPISDELLLGIGQAGTEDGTLTGTQVSLFDVSDPGYPERIQQYEVADGSSTAEYDHRAFLWWAESNLAVLPVSVYGYDGDSSESFEGAVGVEVTDEAITEVGTITNNDPDVDCEVPQSSDPSGDDTTDDATDDTTTETTVPDELGETDADDGVIDGDDIIIDEEPVAPTTTIVEEPPVDDPTTIVPPEEDEVAGCAAEPILRSIVIGDSLLTLSTGLLQQSDLATLEPTAAVSFG
jgi:uncharacterized secreted protein with C-terminal beta-propeller domain